VHTLPQNQTIFSLFGWGETKARLKSTRHNPRSTQKWALARVLQERMTPGKTAVSPLIIYTQRAQLYRLSQHAFHTVYVLCVLVYSDLILL
jgi:hypothetical protein